MLLAERMLDLPEGIFTEMDRIKVEVEQRGLPVINLGIGSPDQPPPQHVIEALIQGVSNVENYSYPSSEGCFELRQAIAQWYLRRFEVELDPISETLVLMGSQDGLAHMAQAYINPEDLALVPDPGYPIYSASITLSGGEIYPLILTAKNNFLPELDKIPVEVALKAKMLLLNYPNNPVAAVADMGFFSEVVAFAKKYNILVCHDAAYSELAFDGYRPMSFLEVPGAKEVGVEFHSVSKSFNMAGCRLGFAVGNAKAIAALAKVKSNIDYGVFLAIQQAGVAALSGSNEITETNALRYQQRRDVLVEGLAHIGWHIPKPRGSMFLWAPLPNGHENSFEFAVSLLKEAGVLVIPGIAFGQAGEGYVRIALTRDKENLIEAVKRIGHYFKG